MTQATKTMRPNVIFRSRQRAAEIQCQNDIREQGIGGKMTHFLEIPRSKDRKAVNVAHHVADFPQSARKFRWHWNAWQWTQSIANSSLLSNFLITGNNAGKFSNFSIQLQFLCFISGANQWTPAKFPPLENRELFEAYQRFFFSQTARHREFLFENLMSRLQGRRTSANVH